MVSNGVANGNCGDILEQKTCFKYGLCRDKVDPRFREPFIISGYRQPNMKVTDCLKSTLVYYCNETINVWSHFLAFLYFVAKFWKYFSVEFSLADPFLWPLLTYAIGILGFCLMSSIAHTFNSVSPQARHTCFSLDYAAISIYSVGAGQAFFFYSRPLNPTIALFHYSAIFSVISVAVSIASTIQCCLTRQKWHSVKYLLRTLSYIMPFFVNTSPYLYRFLYGKGIDSCGITSTLFKAHATLYLLAGMANVSRLPERYLPGSFDVIGQSHHLMHIFTAVGAGIQFETVKLDMLNRRDVLLQQPDQVLSSNSFYYMFVATVINFGVAFWFGMRSHVSDYVKNGSCVKNEAKKHD